MSEAKYYEIVDDDLSQFANRGPAFVTFGEVMVRDTPADKERPERTRLVNLSMAGSEYTLAIALSRLGIPSAYITRVPDNPYGRAVENIAREQGVNVEHIVRAPQMEPIGRFIYELGRTPRQSVGIYQRMFSAASRLGAGMVDWETVLKDARLFHSSGISFGLAAHSNYERNYNYEAFEEALASKPDNCLVGFDFNYRSSLWPIETARQVLTPVVSEHVDVLVSSMVVIAGLYQIGCGPYSVKQIVDGEIGSLEDEDIREFIRRTFELFDGVKVIAVTLRYPDTFEQHRWEAAAMDSDGNYFRSPVARSVTLWDRLGGGDAWAAGFYYGLLTEDFESTGLAKGVLVGDAASRLKQTLMFDLPIIDKAEVQSLMKSEAFGGGKRTVR